MEKIEKINSIALKRGFFFPSAEIYGGKSGFYTYGHLGKLIKNNFENLWRKFFLEEENFWEIEGSCILPEQVFKASGHLEHFKDPLVECENCHFKFRADQLIEDRLKIKAEGLCIKKINEIIKKNKLRCPRCKGNLKEARWFNMMFPLSLGISGEGKAFLIPETAQNAFLSFKREFENLRKKIPLGLAMIGKVFRNEISPRQLFFRLREFTQAELQIFFDSEKIDKLDKEKWEKIKKEKLILKPVNLKKEKLFSLEQANKNLKLPKFYLHYMLKIQKFYLEILKIPREKFRFRELGKEERAFYNKIHWDIELKLETLNGFKEVAGIHYRSDYDLKSHEKESKESLEVFTDHKFLPHVIELSFGVDRNIWAFLDIFFKKEKTGEKREMFCFPTEIAPIEIAVFPLVSKDGLPKKAKEVYENLKNHFKTFYDESGSIGRRYRRQDETGTPFCITIDHQTLKDNTVTIRDRDTMKQIRTKISKLKEIISKIIKGEKFLKLGKVIG